MKRLSTTSLPGHQHEAADDNAPGARGQDAPRLGVREAGGEGYLAIRKEPVDTWLTWEALSIAMAGETLTPEEREPFCAVTGREPPGAQIAQLIHMEIQRYFETDRQSNLTKEEANHIERTLMAMPEDKQNPRPRKKKFMIA